MGRAPHGHGDEAEVEHPGEQQQPDDCPLHAALAVLIPDLGGHDYFTSGATSKL